jgi:hypothetical protein
MKLPILNPQLSTGMKVFAGTAIAVLFLLAVGASGRQPAADPVAETEDSRTKYPRSKTG